MNDFNVDLFLYFFEKNDDELLIDTYNENKELIDNSFIEKYNVKLKILEYVLILSIIRNNIKLVKWIHSLNEIDIDFHRNFCFNIACQYKRNNILNWFHEINPKYNYVIENNIYKSNVEGTPPYFIRKEMWNELIEFLKLKKNKNIEYENCAICYEKSNILTSCKHHFCLECLGKWYVKCKIYKEKCPYCRNKLKLSQCIYFE